MALNTKEEKIILLKDLNGVNKAVIEKGITAPKSETVLSILKDNASTDVITSVATYTKFFNHITTSGNKPWIQKALFIKDMEGKAVPINPAEPTILTQFTKGESAIVYMDDIPTAMNGNGRPHFLKFMADTTLRKIGITFVSTYAKLNAEPDQAWYFVEDMAGYGDYDSLESALVYKWNSTNLETWRSEESDLIPGDELWRLHNLAVQDITPGATAPTAGSEAIFAWGDLSDAPQRKTFMDKALVGQWGTAQISGDRYLFNVKSKPTAAGSTAIIGGFRFVNGPSGWTAEFVQGAVTELNAPTVTTGSFTGDAFSSSIALPIAYTQTQYVPKAVIEQMFIENAPVDARHWVVLEENQIESVLGAGGTEIIWRMSDNLLSLAHPDGHPITEGMVISFSQGTAQSEVKVRMVEYDTAGEKKDMNDVLITDGHNTRQVIRALDNTVVGSFFPKVSKITDWVDGWDGTGTPTGTDAGWKVELTDPRDVNGGVITFPTTALPTQMTLDSIKVGADDVQVILTQSDLMPQLSTWLVQGKSNHISGNYTEGFSQVFDVVDARMEKTLGAWDGSHQWTGTSRDMSTIGIGRPRYLIMGIVNDQTAGYQYYARFKFDLVKADGNVAGANDAVDYTKVKMTYEGTKGADAVGQALTHRPRTFTGFDLKEGV